MHPAPWLGSGHREGRCLLRLLLLAAAFFAVIVAAAVLGLLWFVSKKGEALEKELASIRNEGLPATAEELDEWYKLPEGSRNAADLYAKAWEAMAAPPSWDGLSEEMLRQLPDPLGHGGLKPWEPMGEEALQRVRAHLKANRRALAAIKQAAEIPTYRSSIDLTDGIVAKMKHLPKLRASCHLLKLEGLARLESQEAHSAADSVLLICQIAERLKGEPTTLSQATRHALFGIGLEQAETVLNRSQLDLKEIERLAAAFPREDGLRSAWTGLIGERAMLTSLYTDFADPDKCREVLGEDGTELPEGAHLPRFWTRVSNAKALELMEEFIEAAQLPVDQRLSRLDTVGRKVRELPVYYPMVRMYVPSCGMLVGGEVAMATRLRLFEMAVAVEKCILATGAPPARAEELVPDLLPAVPEDPYDGADLRYKKTAEGYLVYSAGNGSGGVVWRVPDPEGEVDTDGLQIYMEVRTAGRRRHGD